MGFIKKFRIEILVTALLIVAYLAIRLYNILHLPIFTDEAIYIRWAQIAKQDASWRFISLTDGKQPMFVWLEVFTLRLFKDPLMAGRVVSVGAGFASMVGLFFVGKELFKNKWIGFLSATLYLIYPFGLVYDRMAMYDSLVGTFTIWALYVEILLVRKVKPELGFILGLVIGGGMLTKTNADFSMILLPVTLVLFDWHQKDAKKKLWQWVIYAGIAVILANVYYSILRLSPWYYIIGEKNDLFVYPLRQWIHHPFTYFFSNFHALFNWFATYFTWPLIIAVLGSLIINKSKIWEKLLMLAWFVVPFIALALFGKQIYPRFILFMTLSLLPLVAYCFYQIFKVLRPQIIAIIVVSLFILPALYSDYYIVTNISKAPIADSDLGQYINGWPSGVGVREAISYISEKATHGKVYLATQGTFGLMPYAFQMYLSNNPNITIQGYWPIDQNLPNSLAASAKKMPTFVFFYQPCVNCPAKGIAPTGWPLHIVLQYAKNEKDSYATLYQVDRRP